jgi:hypothetical protein
MRFERVWGGGWSEVVRYLFGRWFGVLGELIPLVAIEFTRRMT